MKKYYGVQDTPRIIYHLSAIAIVIFFSAIFLNCAEMPINLKWNDTTTPCTVCQDMAEKYPDNQSLICARIPNPCKAQDILVAFSKAGVVWEAWKVDEFKKWTAATRDVISRGMSYKALHDYVMAYVLRFNKKFGGTYILMTEMIIDFQDNTMIDPADKDMLLMALDGLDKEIESYRIFE